MMDLNHDNIVRVFDHFKEGSKHYIVMEFVEGCSLDEILKKGGPLPAATCRLILYSCCQALDYIHSRNIIHRDIKPSNIFISRDGSIKLGDFGIAQLENVNQESGEFSPVGTPSYMAPEQFLPRARITRRTDLYALSVTLYEMLTGEKLYDGESLDDLKWKILHSRHNSLLPLMVKQGFPLYWIIRKGTFRPQGFRFSGVRPILRLLKLAAPSTRDSSAREVLLFLVDSVSSVPDKKRKDILTPAPHQEKTLFPWKRILFSGGLFLFLLFLGFFSFQTGGVYRLFFRNTHGQLQVRIFQGEDFPHAGDLILYKDKTTHLEQIKAFDLNRSDGLGRALFLKSGHYRIMVRWGSQVEWQLFYLPPLDEQNEPFFLDISTPEIPRKVLSVEIAVRDSRSGRELSDSATLSVFLNNRWVAYEDSSLSTGNAYRFRIDCPGYNSRYLNVPLQFYQDHLKLGVQLVPHVSGLRVESDLENLALYVNGQSSLMGGGEDPSLQRFGKIKSESQEWELYPGDYSLLFSSGDKKLNVDMTLQAGSRNTIRLIEKDGALAALRE